MCARKVSIVLCKIVVLVGQTNNFAGLEFVCVLTLGFIWGKNYEIIIISILSGFHVLHAYICESYIII